MESISSYLDLSKYRLPSAEEVVDAQQYARDRVSYGNLLNGEVDEILSDLAEEIAKVCMTYIVKAKDFRYSANKEMQEKVFALMDEAEDEILSLIESYSTIKTERKDRHAFILWLSSLGRNNLTLRDTLHGYLFRFLYDVEALVAAYKLRVEAGTATQAAAVGAIPSKIHSVYADDTVRAAFSVNGMNARYIQSRGIIMDGQRGVPRLGADAVLNMGKLTLQMAWWRNQTARFLKDGVAGYLQLRGSNYQCGVCDSEVGFHPFSGNAEQIMQIPLVHFNCMCYRIPIYLLDPLMA